MRAAFRSLTDFSARPFRLLLLGFILGIMPILIAFQILRLWGVDLSIPFHYNGGDVIWQLTLTKMAVDSGWILSSPFMGAPDIAHWHNNASAQTSAVHSVAIWLISRVIHDPVEAQQLWYILNFPLIAISAFTACRLLKVSTLLSACVGLAYAFVGFRFNAMVYSFLANFFVIPLSVVPAVWVMTGTMVIPAGFSDGRSSVLLALRKVLASRTFIISLPIVTLTAVSDGYYAFFTLLLLGFAFAVRAVQGDFLRPLSLAVPGILIVTLMSTALTLAAPLRAYQKAHPEEFQPNGVVDTTLTKQPFEAEVYSVSIKMMLAPPATHQIPALGQFGTWVLQTANEVRKFPAMVLAPLGTLGSLLFLAMLVLIPAIMTGNGVRAGCRDTVMETEPERWSNFGAVVGLALFVTLSSISGGLGSLVALAYPTIRAYDRFTLYLIFLLFAGAALIVTLWMRRSNPKVNRICRVLAPLLVVLAIVDQTPVGVYHRDPSIERQFRAEKRFVQAMEAALPAGAMVYQFPHSQYLLNNRYYGWGEFLHVRAYQHSRNLRWSNGAAKNSWVDTWHIRMAQLPPLALAHEMKAVGFRAFMVDLRVVKGEEYMQLREVMTSYVGQPPIEDELAGFAWWPLSDAGFRLEYDARFEAPERIVVTDPRDVSRLHLPSTVSRDALLRVLGTMPADRPAVVERSVHQNVFRDGVAAGRGFGQASFESDQMRSNVSCGLGMDQPLSASRESVALRVSNLSDYDWLLNNGPLPIRIGLKELVSLDGTRLQWDAGLRSLTNQYVARGQTIDVRIPLNSLDLRSVVPDGQSDVVGVFAIVQDGHAWYGGLPGNTECRVHLVP